MFLQLQYFDVGDKNIHVHMAYADQDAFLEWSLSEDNEPNAQELPPILDSVHLEVFGAVDGETKTYLDSWGAIYFDRVAGMSRFNTLKTKVLEA